MNVPRLAVALVLPVLLCGELRAGPAEDAPESRFAYLRDAANPADAVKRVFAAARERGADAIALVLDRVTFDPPPGVSEYDPGGVYVADRRAWLEAAADDAAAAGDSRVFVATTTSARLRAAGRDDVAALEREFDGDIWRTTGPDRPIISAEKWIDALATQMKGKRKAIVLVTGEFFPESWFRMSTTHDTPSGRYDPWRAKLLSSGLYWDEEEVAVAAKKRGATLLVVAPEAKFGDCQAIDDVPEAPFASRPQAVPAKATTDPPSPRTGAKLDTALAASMADELRRRGFDETAVKTAMALKEKDALEPPDHRPAGRFRSATPDFFPLSGQQLAWNTDCPSGYGVWRLARAAAATGGAYELYPFPKARWMDACCRDATLLDALAPPVVSRERIVSAAKNDAALAAMLAAQAEVIDVTPWADNTKGYGLAFGGLAGWCGFELPGPAPVKRWTPRTKPFDLEWWLTTPREIAATASRCVEKYRHALRGLEAAAADPRVAAAPRRSQANLRLCRFWFEASLFHFQALELAGREPVRFGAREKSTKKDDLCYWRAVRLSDCLPAYDGRALTAPEEEAYGPKWADNGSYQGAFLAIESGDPNYRAQRDVDLALAKLDARLKPQALQAIAAARNVMEHEARSPWGWVVYYSELQTYGWDAVDEKPSSDRTSSEPQHETTPAGSTPPPPTTTPK